MRKPTPLPLLLAVVLGALPVTVHAACGDVNADGSVTVVDALLYASGIVGVTQLTALQREEGDVDGDGAGDVRDVLLIAQFAAGLRVTFGCVCRAPAAAPAPGNPYDPARLAWMADLAAIASASIARVDVPAYPIFHGCLDWHSAVHSHWMLIRYARVTGDTTHDAQVQASLCPGGIDQEAANLRASPWFEMPYGRAWFLRLVIDYEVHFGDPLSLRTMGDEVLASMEAYYAASPPTPLATEYANASWAFSQMVDYARHTGDAAGFGRLEAIVETRFDLASAASLAFDRDHIVPEFFSVFGNWVHLVATGRCARTFVDYEAMRSVTMMNLSPVSGGPTGPTGHELGMNPSRAWALASLARMTGDPVYAAAWESHVQLMEIAHTVWAGDYLRYDHWVPSFCMYALTEPLQ